MSEWNQSQTNDRVLLMELVESLTDMAEAYRVALGVAASDYGPTEYFQRYAERQVKLDILLGAAHAPMQALNRAVIHLEGLGGIDTPDELPEHQQAPADPEGVA